VTRANKAKAHEGPCAALFRNSRKVAMPGAKSASFVSNQHNLSRVATADVADGMDWCLPPSARVVGR